MKKNYLDKDQNFDKVSITIASPDVIRSWSKGQIKNPETINYRTFKPESGGLFCQRIFGPIIDYECGCGKYKRIKYKGLVCDRCGVEVTVSRVRRERMGHIELVVPVTHIWYLKNMPSRLGILLNMTVKSLESVIYYENYMVTESGETDLEKGKILTEAKYLEYKEEYGENAFIAKIGAEAIRDLLSTINLEELSKEIQEQILVTNSKQIKKKLSKRLKTVEGLLSSNTRPEWMVLEVLPVIPPDLRPLVPLEGGRFATSDLNDLYRRVINRNNRLKNLLNLKTPEVIINNEKRMLQESVDSLFDNGRQGRTVTTSGNRPLKSLSEMLKGKQGRFRQNLLGKRVDYSGRSVIVIGPELKLHQCGLPKKMALVLFEPFIIKRLQELEIVNTVRAARKMIEKRSTEVWNILEEVIKDHPVILNRAPTLHKLSIQSFEPVLIEGDAIRIHPLVCTSYNADFDGDQMAVHVPLSLEAVLESKLLMLSTNNIFMPSSGKPVFTPSQDIVMGAYYLTLEILSNEGKRIPLLEDIKEALMAEETGVLNKHDWVNIVNPDYQKETYFGDNSKKIIKTTVGRIIFNTVWPSRIGYINSIVNKHKLEEIILQTYKLEGKEVAVKTLDLLKEVGFKYATQAGISIGVLDMIIPENKYDIINKARNKIEDIEAQYKKGIITQGERYNKVIDIWTNATDDIAKEVFDKLEQKEFNKHISPVFLMMDSGARGNRQQVRQLCGMRGLMARPSGEIIERPVISSFREGLSVLEYFNSTHGARKGLADTALKTADAGYLTRKLCDVAMDVTITSIDDGNRSGVWKQAIYEGDEEIISLKERIEGRCSSDDIYDPLNEEKIIVKNGDIITKEISEIIEKLGINRVKVISPLTSKDKNSLTATSYGIDPATGQEVEIGTAVGIIAAQSIGEPGTQLTMRTFHVGGIASQILKNPEIKIRKSGYLNYSKDLKIVKTLDGSNIVINKTGSLIIKDEKGKEIESYKIVSGTVLPFKDEEKVEIGDIIAMWDPHNIPIISEKGGIIAFKDMIPGVTIKKEIDYITGSISNIIIDHKEDLNPNIYILESKEIGSKVIASYSIPTGAQVVIEEGSHISPGALLAKTPRSASKTQDITGGLPRIAELFEARKPKDSSYIAKIDGIIDIQGTSRGKKRLVIKNSENEEEHLIAHGKHIIVNSGDFIHKGQSLTEGSPDLYEILDVLGIQAVQEHLISEIQKVYRLQGVVINDKHLEIIISKMLRKIKITDPGDSNFLWGEEVDTEDFALENNKINQHGGKKAEGKPLLLGITKAALETDSFISAASFMETTRVLTDASIIGKTDYLKGFKENVIMGHLIPAGTGLPKYRKLKVIENK